MIFLVVSLVVLVLILISQLSTLSLTIDRKDTQLNDANSTISDLKDKLVKQEESKALSYEKASLSLELDALKNKLFEVEAENTKLHNRLSMETDFHNRLKKNFRDLELKLTDTENKLSPYLVLPDLDAEIHKRQDTIKQYSHEILAIEEKLSLLDGYYSDYFYGAFHASFKFEHIIKYKQALDLVEYEQKKLQKTNQDFICNNQELQNSPIFKSIKTLALSYINSEVTRLIDRATPQNFQSSCDKLNKLYNFMSVTLSSLNCSIGSNYFSLFAKKMEVSVAYEEEQDRIKAEQKEIKAMLKEEEDARLEAEELLEKSEQEEKKYNDLISKALSEFEVANDIEKRKLETEIEQLKIKLSTAHEATIRATSLAQITRAGHVYIISNIGSFGENIFKIGLTRRENPLDRVKELGDASVPFSFDIHALIKVDDAPKLESELHKAFEERRINKLNRRKEFFNVSIDEIERVCSEKGLQFKITKIAEAFEYYSTVQLNNEKKAS
jgi:predicted nuclease with TOPRIM domain